MSQQYLNDGEEEKVRSQAANEPERREGPHEDDGQTSSRADETVTMNVAPRRQRRSKNSGDSEPAEPMGPQDDRATPADAEQETTVTSPLDDLHALEALGFTEDEAARLIAVAVRISTSDEARDAEATRKRLQFTKWLIERGRLDEFSLSD